jgi:hypothetical protein
MAMKLLRWTGVAIVSLIVLGIAAALILIGPRNVIGMLRYDQRDEGTLTVGSEFRNVELVALDGTHQQIRDWIGRKPVVLIFGSFT